MDDRFEATILEMGERARQTADNAAGGAMTEARGLYDQAVGKAQQAWGQARNAGTQVGGAVRAQPLIAAAVAICIGFLLGRVST